MKNLDTDKVYSSRLLYDRPYNIIDSKSSDNILQKIVVKNPLFKIPENTLLCGIVGCYQDIPLNQIYDFVFRHNNIEDSATTKAIIKNVYALGVTELDTIPATWGVTALIEFPDGIPSLISTIETNGPLYLCSKNFWEDLLKVYS